MKPQLTPTIDDVPDLICRLYIYDDLTKDDISSINSSLTLLKIIKFKRVLFEYLIFFSILHVYLLDFDFGKYKDENSIYWFDVSSCLKTFFCFISAILAVMLFFLPTVFDAITFFLGFILFVHVFYIFINISNIFTRLKNRT
jgi:hypothetical protein